MTDEINHSLQPKPSDAGRRANTGSRLNSVAETALRASGVLWFLVAATGQWIFVYYIAAHPIYLILSQGLPGLNQTHMPQGYIAGDTFGNLALAMHLFMAAIIIGGGPLQLIPQVRSRFPGFHHWNGRVYMAGAVLSALGGFYLIWARSPDGSILQKIAVSIGAALIVVFAALTLRYAVARKIGIHRRWALRLFMAVSAVWFLRIGYSLWFYFSDLTGIEFKHLFDFLVFAQYLVPLAVLEVYLHARHGAGMTGRFVVATGLFLMTVLMGSGIFLATRDMWLPRILA